MVKSVQMTISTKLTAIGDSKDLKPREVERDQGLVLSWAWVDLTQTLNYKGLLWLTSTVTAR